MTHFRRSQSVDTGLTRIISGLSTTSASSSSASSDTDESEEKQHDTIQHQHHHKKCVHIMFLYNSKSGGQSALSLLKYFGAYTSLMYDLFELNSSVACLQKLGSDLERYEDKLIVCIVGGDGSQCWAASLIDKAIQLKLPKEILFPVIIPYPIGTGNDLSRALGWGHIEKSRDKIIKHVADAQFCYNHSQRFDVLDRWSINYTFDGIKDHETYNDYLTTFNPPLPEKFLCYMSIGYDALLTCQFQKEREENPQKFTSQKSNQLLWAKLGMKEIMNPSDPINNRIILEIDGQSVEIPKNTRSLKCVNINSAASGTYFFGKKHSKRFKKPRLHDGKIEVMTTTGAKDLTMIKSGLLHAHRLGQSNHIKIKVTNPPVYLQIDGEGWRIDCLCTLFITSHDQLPTLIGYKLPRGVYHKFDSKHFTAKLKKERHRFRNIIKMIYHIPDKFSADYDPKEFTPRKSLNRGIPNITGNLVVTQKKDNQEEKIIMTHPKTMK